jgi:Calx-beta domain/FG-GAP-like repeat/Bacterial Ig-like domain (group 2)/ASPIC and UnbV
MKPIAHIYAQFRASNKRLSGRRIANKKRFRRPAIERMEERTLLAASFFAAAEPTGSVNVQLDPLANVTPGAQEIVTFGVPFTRGSVTPSQLAQVRVLKNGVEIPAFVEQLASWRSIDDPAVDGQSVRVARVQIAYVFASLNPESITVQWGGPTRSLNRTTLQDPRASWHTVTSGTFVAADNVEEPDVLPVLPAAYLAKGMLDSRTDPTNSAVAETRDDPAVMDAKSFTGYQEYDYAEKNFFYTIINQNPGITIDYKTQAEPWLYDRSAGMYELYFRSGFATALREAVRAADFYADHLDSSGFFTLKPGDPKYAYNESLAYTYWLLGDNRMLAPISTVVNAYSGTATHWTPNLSFFTERNVGDKLLANEMAYEVTGNATFKSSVQTIVGDLIWHQNGAGGQLPSNRIDGGLYHTGEQHDISEASSADVLIASSWMSVLIVDPMVRAYSVWQSPQITDFIVRMGNFEKATSKTDANGQFGGTTRYPDYLMRADGVSDSRSDTDVQHAMDVGSVAAWATYFAELRGTPDPSLRQLANDLYATYDVGVNFWTRPGGTNFNVSPPRRYTWEYKNSPSFSWALTGVDAPGQAGVLRFSAGGYSVVENQGVAAITVTRTGGATGAVTVDYATSNGSATAGSDYNATSGTLTFADGETTKTITVPIINDAAVENAETLTLTLSNPTSGAALSSPATSTLTIFSDDTTNQPVTNTFQQGVNGYTGTTDAEISTQYADSTGGNGSTATDGNQLGVYQLAGANGYTIEGLIRFGDLGITTHAATNAAVTSATLTLTVETFDANPTIRGYYLLAPWTTAAGTDLGWLHRGTGQDWAGPGALGQGADVVAGKSFVVPGIAGNGTQTITVNLDPAVVQSWIDNPSANQGVLLVNQTTGAVVRVDASENAAAALRPKLSVSYTVSSAAPQPGALQFSNATYSVNENQGTATITLTRTGGSAGSVSVNYATSNGTATAGSDYTTASGTLTFADGETTKTFAIPIIDDSLVEGNETVNLALSSPTGGATLGSLAAATLTIVDNDAAPSGAFQFSAPTYSITEGQPTATVTVTRTGGSAGGVSVNYATSNGTATAGSDYTATSGTLTFTAGETTKTFSVPIIDDTLVEGDETVNLTLSNPTGGATLGSPITAALTIVDNDVAQPGAFQFSAGTYSVGEAQPTATITVTRTGNGNVPASVHYAASDGTATAGSDYSATSGTLTFAAGETSKTFTIPIIDDTLVEGNETVNLTLTAPTGGATLGSPAAATITIVDNDVAQPGALQFSAVAYSVGEAQSTATITVTRTGGSAGGVSVNFATSNGTATAGNDYTAASGTLTFAAGETSKTFTIPIIDDALVEGNETVNLTLSSPTGGATLGATATAALTIVDNDGQAVTVTLQQGVNGYTGTNDTSISTQYGQYNGGNGTTTYGGDQLGAYQTTGSGSYSVEDLIRFNNLGIPAGAVVSSATLTLSVYTWTANPTIRGYYLLAPWNGAPSSGANSLGWVHRGTGQDWAAPGALGQGTDVVAGRTFVLPGIRAVGAQTITVNLDPAVVRSWIDNPSANQGISLVNETTGAIVWINASANSAVASRPKLSVTYTVGVPAPLQSISMTPINPSVLNGQTTQFTATGHYSDGSTQVLTTGVNWSSSNTAVATIASSGLASAAGVGSTTITATFGAFSTSTSLTVTAPTTSPTLGAHAVVFVPFNSPAGVLSTNPINTQATGSTVLAWVGRGAISTFTSATVPTDNRGNTSTQIGTTHSYAPLFPNSGMALYTFPTFAGGNGDVFSVPMPTPDEVTLMVVEIKNGGLIQDSQWNQVSNGPQTSLSVTTTGPATLVSFWTGDASASSVTAVPNNGFTVIDSQLLANNAIEAAVATKDVSAAGTYNVTWTATPQQTGYIWLVAVQHANPVPHPGTLQLSSSSYSVNENQGTASITVTRSGGSDGSVSVNYATSNGTATAGSDYTAASGTLTFAAGETSKTFTVPIIDDTLVEGNEMVNLTLSSPTGGATLGSPATAPLTIVDNDVAQPGAFQFSAGTYSVGEAQPTATITVNRTGAGNVPATIHYATSNGTATAASDYTATSGTLSFAAGETSKTFSIPIIDDTLVEGNETVNLTLTAPTGGATLGSPTAAALTIIDNDSPPLGAFTNVTDASGVTAIIAQKYQQDPNWWLSGEHLVDLDNDGKLDLFLDGHNGGAVAALNNGSGVFTRVASGSWPDLEIHEMFDINGDGKVDLCATFQDGGAQWWINHSTPGVVNFTPTSVTRGGNTARSQVMMDFNGDGKVDWLRSAEPGLVVDFGDGNGGFTEGSRTFAIPGTDSNNNASFLPADFNGDGKTDLLVITGGNYDGTPGKTAYWRNNGDMTFTDVTASAGLPANGTVAKGVGDFDQDGRIDIIAVENKSMPPVIYLNNGSGGFTRKPNAISGVVPGGLDYTFWGTAVTTDIDNDGVPDIIMNGKYYLKVLRGTGGGNFTYMNNTWGILDTAASAVDDGLCFGDIDGNGSMDVIGYNETFPTRTLNVYRNDLAPQNWLNVRPVGLSGNIGAAGAKISVFAAGTTQLLWYEQVAQYDFQVATSYYGYGETERHYGLGNRAKVDVVVQFASGRVTRVNDVAANQTLHVFESAGV